MDAAFLPIKFVFLLLLGGIFRNNKAAHATSTSGGAHTIDPIEVADKLSEKDRVMSFQEDGKGAVNQHAGITTAAETEAASEKAADPAVSTGLGDTSHLVVSVENKVSNGSDFGIEASVGIAITDEVPSVSVSVPPVTDIYQASDISSGFTDRGVSPAVGVEADCGDFAIVEASTEVAVPPAVGFDLIGNGMPTIDSRFDKTQAQTASDATKTTASDVSGHEEILLGEDVELELGVNATALAIYDPLVKLEPFELDLKGSDFDVNFVVHAALDGEQVAERTADRSADPSPQLFPELLSAEIAVDTAIDGFVNFEKSSGAVLEQSDVSSFTAEDAPELGKVKPFDFGLDSIATFYTTIEEPSDASELFDDVFFALGHEEPSRSDDLLSMDVDIDLESSLLRLGAMDGVLELDFGSLPIVPMSTSNSCYSQREDETDVESDFLVSLF